MCARNRWSSYQQTSILCLYRLEKTRSKASETAIQTWNCKFLFVEIFSAIPVKVVAVCMVTETIYVWEFMKSVNSWLVIFSDWPILICLWLQWYVRFIFHSLFDVLIWLLSDEKCFRFLLLSLEKVFIQRLFYSLKLD